MSSLSDIFAFDKFALKDLWRGIKDDPERLLIGAADPWSTKMWNKILGKDWEPLVDQMGGPYGGHTISAFGNNEGGVYGRAREAGIDTKAGAGAHDAAHVIAAMFAGNYGMEQLGGGIGTGTGTEGGMDWTQFARQPMQMQQRDPYAAQREAEERRRRQREEEERKRQQRIAEALRRLTEQRYV